MCSAGIRWSCTVEIEPIRFVQAIAIKKDVDATLKMVFPISKGGELIRKSDCKSDGAGNSVALNFLRRELRPTAMEIAMQRCDVRCNVETGNFNDVMPQVKELSWKVLRGQAVLHR